MTQERSMILDANKRRAQKQRSRQKDAIDLASGAIAPQPLRDRNGLLARMGPLRIVAIGNRTAP